MHAAIPLKSSPTAVPRAPAGPGASEALQALYRTLFLCSYTPEADAADAREPQPADPGPPPRQVN